jgi:hypothetical protein
MLRALEPSEKNNEEKSKRRAKTAVGEWRTGGGILSMRIWERTFSLRWAGVKAEGFEIAWT